MDKISMKAIFRAHGLPVVDYLAVSRAEWRRDPAGVRRRVSDGVGFPCFVKPSNLGSSVGISKVATPAALPAALDEAARYDRRSSWSARCAHARSR
jgi:D-alanine-D-alanine ligase